MFIQSLSRSRKALFTLSLALCASPLQAAPTASPSQEASHLIHAELSRDAKDGDQKLNFKAFATEFLGAHGLNSKDLSFRDMVDSDAFARLDIGSFEIRIPVDALKEKSTAMRVQESVHALVNIQEHWYAWSGTAPAEANADWKAVSKWVESWSARKLAALQGGSDSMFVQLVAQKSVLDAVERLNQWTIYHGEIADLLGERNLTVLAPTRKHFHLISAAAGLLRPDLKDKLWRDDIIRQGACWLEYVQIIALENFGSPIQWDRPFLSRSLNESDKNGLKQFVADRASTVLMRKEFFRHGTHFFEEALAINLIIEYLGFNSNGPPEFDFKYKKKGAKTQPYERFVPGGNPGGGTLPPRRAQSGPGTMSGTMGGLGSYRSNLGADYFVGPLKEGQKAGAKLANKIRELSNRKDKLPHFMLTAMETGGEAVVSAPFLGLLAEGKTLPDNEFLDDYEDFFRAYRSCFFHWLRTKAADKESEALFGKLITAHAMREIGQPLDEIIQTIYGAPLSGTDAKDGNLEFRFLSWIKKGR